LPQELLSFAIFHTAILLQQLRFLLALAMPFLALPLPISILDILCGRAPAKTIHVRSQAASREIETALAKIRKEKTLCAEEEVR
jgi:hypothetical protein